METFMQFLKNPNNWPLFAIPLLLLAWAGFGAPALGLASFASVDSYSSPYLAALPPGPPGEAITPRVVLVIVDGLRVDASQQMATLNALRSRGASRILTVGQPSLSLPGATVIATGAWQEQDGVTSNSYKGSVKLDSIFHAAKRQGLTTRAVAGKTWDRLFPGGIDSIVEANDPGDMETNFGSIAKYEAQMTDLALQAIAAKPNLLLVHFSATDNAGHGWGGASQQYAAAAQLVDGNIAKLLGSVDLRSTTFIVTADHGHIDAGGHAGWEPSVIRVPFVAAGKGIKPGQYPDARQADIAPTLATLLGAAIPSESQGQILADQSDAAPALLAARSVDNARELADRYDSMLRVITSGQKVDRASLSQAQTALQAGDNSGALSAAASSIKSTWAAWDAAVAGRLNGERLMRGGIAVLILLPLVLYLVWWKRARWNWTAPLAAAVVYFAAWNANYFLVDRLTYSLSAFNSEEMIREFLTNRVMEAMLALVLAMLVVGLLSFRENPGEVARRAVNCLFLIAAALGAQILVFYVLWGVLFTWHLPDLFWGFKYYLDLFQMTAFYPLPYLPLAVLLPIVAQLAAWAFALLARLVPGGAPREGAPGQAG